jgi:hypothetical protein
MIWVASSSERRLLKKTTVPSLSEGEDHAQGFTHSIPAEGAATSVVVEGSKWNIVTQSHTFQ